MDEPKSRRSLTRCYRILGLLPGASESDIKKSYRDLAQVWHPDRFAHDPRLQSKAQDNLKRINDAFHTLQAADLSEQPTALSRISSSFSAILGIGDLVKTATFPQPIPQRKGPRVLTLDDDKRSRARRGPLRFLLLWVVVLVLIGGVTVMGVLLW
jgi:hypothetical protein